MTQNFGPLLLLVVLAAALTGCRSAPLRPIPDPPPEAAEWERRDTAGVGAYLGVATRENDSGRLDDLFFEPGVRIVRVDPGSPAQAAGLDVGDVVLAWNGVELLEPESLAALERGANGGDIAKLEVRRDDTILEVPVALRARALGSVGDVAVVAHVDPVRSRARWWDARDGARLVANAADAPFAAAGIPTGAIVHTVDAREVVSARELIRLLLARKPGAKVRVTWSDPDAAGGATRESVVRLQDVPRVTTGFSVPILATYTHDPDARSTSFVLIDLWFISLLRYTGEGEEREWRFLRWFSTSSGVGELSQ